MLSRIYIYEYRIFAFSTTKRSENINQSRIDALDAQLIHEVTHFCYCHCLLVTGAVRVQPSRRVLLLAGTNSFARRRNCVRDDDV